MKTVIFRFRISLEKKTEPYFHCTEHKLYGLVAAYRHHILLYCVENENINIAMRAICLMENFIDRFWMIIMESSRYYTLLFHEDTPNSLLVISAICLTANYRLLLVMSDNICVVKRNALNNKFTVSKYFKLIQ